MRLTLYRPFITVKNTLRMKTRLEEAVRDLAKFDETLIDLHGEGTLDGFSYA